MTRPFLSLLAAAAAGTGCLSMPTWWEKPKPAPPAMAAKPAPRPVTAAQITDGNAQQMADALLNELDRDAQTELPTRSSNTSTPR
jgi:hypothetical protein